MHGPARFITVLNPRQLLLNAVRRQADPKNHLTSLLVGLVLHWMNAFGCLLYARPSLQLKDQMIK